MMPVFQRSLFTTFFFLLASAAGASEVSELPATVRAALERYSLDPSGLSILVRDLHTGEDILSIHPEMPRNPASTMKLLTGLGALELLGPAHRWTTRVYASSKPVNGILEGDLYWEGSGDPYLVEERLYLMLQGLRRKNLHTISGNLILDDSLFARITEDTGAFDQQPFRIYNANPSAVLSNFNSTRFEFRPADNNSVSITAIPDLPGLRIRNALKLRAAACRGYRRGISLGVDSSGGIRFDGEFPQRCKAYRFTRSVMAAYRYTGELVQKIWTGLGGSFRGSVKRGLVPETAVKLFDYDSLSLAEVVRLMNKHSSNLVARHLILSIAAARQEAPATEADGIRVLSEWLTDAGIDTRNMVIENGAGRSRKARLSAAQLVAVIEYGFASRYMPEFLASLPILGEDGTLSDRDFSPGLRGQAHLKTGRIDHVAALAGVFQHPNGRRYALAILHNDTNVHRGTGAVVQDRLLQWLGSQNPGPVTR